MIQKCFVYSLIFLFPILVVSCNSNNGKTQSSVSNIAVSGFDSAQGKSFVYTKYKLKLSVETYKFLKSKNIPFNKQYMLDLSSQDKFFTDEKRALALGTYSSNLVYATIFDRSQESVDYFGASIELAHKLDVDEGYNSKILDKAYKNLENPDSLNQIASEAYWKTCTSLEKNNRDNILPLIIMSSWIESVYTLSKASAGSSPEDGLYSEMYNQKENLANLIVYFNDVITTQKESELSSILAKWLKNMEQLLAKYNEIEVVDISKVDIQQLENIILQIENFRSLMIE